MSSFLAIMALCPCCEFWSDRPSSRRSDGSTCSPCSGTWAAILHCRHQACWTNCTASRSSLCHLCAGSRWESAAHWLTISDSLCSLALTSYCSIRFTGAVWRSWHVSVTHLSWTTACVCPSVLWTWPNNYFSVGSMELWLVEALWSTRGQARPYQLLWSAPIPDLS